MSLVPPAEFINPVKDKRDSKNKNVLKTGSLEKTIFHSGEKSQSYDMKSNLKDHSHLNQKNLLTNKCQISKCGRIKRRNNIKNRTDLCYKVNVEVGG